MVVVLVGDINLYNNKIDQSLTNTNTQHKMNDSE